MYGLIMKGMLYMLRASSKLPGNNCCTICKLIILLITSSTVSCICKNLELLSMIDGYLLFGIRNKILANPGLYSIL